MGRKIVVIGGVACGPKAAARARRHDQEAEITIIERREYVSYASCGLPYYVGGVVPELDGLLKTSHGTLRDVDYFDHVKDIKVLCGTDAVAIDRQKKEVRIRNLASGEESLVSYDTLVLATGASPVRPPVPGIDLENVWNLWTLRDADIIRQRIEEGEADRVCVIGAGLIGLEACEALVNQAVEVALVEMMPHALYGPLDADMAALVAHALEEQDVELHLGEAVKALEGEDGRVVRVVTDKASLDVDAVIVGAGARPEVSLAKACGLELGETGAIVVDRHMRTSDPDIYAGGDCVENEHLVTGRKVWIPLGSTANRHGRVIGDNATGHDVHFTGVQGTGVMKCLGLNVGYTGISDTAARSLGYDTVTSMNTCNDKSHFFPGGKGLVVKFVCEKASRKLLGCQVVGAGDVARNVDAAASALRFGATLDDMAEMDFCYAPPYGAPITPLGNAAYIASNKLAGMAEAISALELRALLRTEEDFMLVDVRSKGELEVRPPIEDPRSQAIDMHVFREKVDSLPRDKKIIVVCQLGQRSYEILQILRSKGFDRAVYLEGGLKRLHANGSAQVGRVRNTPDAGGDSASPGTWLGVSEFLEAATATRHSNILNDS